MKHTNVILTLLISMASLRAYCVMPDNVSQEQAMQTVRQFESDATLSFESVIPKTASEDAGPLAENSWILVNNDKIWSVSAYQPKVIDFSSFTRKRRSASDSLTRTVAQKYLGVHVPKFSQGFYSELYPGSYARVTSHGFIDYCNTCSVNVTSDGTVDHYEFLERPSPTFDNAVVMSLSQAEQIAASYVLNGLTDAPAVTCSAMKPVPLIIFTPAGIYEVAYAFEVHELNSDDSVTYACLAAVDAQTGSVYHEDIMGGSSSKGRTYHRNVMVPVAHVFLNGSSIGSGIMVGSQIVLDNRLIQRLAAGHKLSAKAGEKAFTLDGKRVALPAKVTAKAGTLYLPWQALKSLPGIKCSYDAKFNRLDITTAKAAAKPAAKPKQVK